MANTIYVELNLDDLDAKKRLDKFEDKAKKAGSKAGNSFGTGFITSFLGNLGASLFRDALRGIADEFGKIKQAGKSIEVIEVQFQTLLKSSKLAQKQLEDLQNFAASTPFQLEGLSLATRQLLSFGIAQKDIIPTLRQIGDLAAATGSRIDELTIPFGRLQSTQKLTLIELDKFADRGINLFGQLSKQTGISLKVIRDEISKGTIPFEEFTKALNSLTNEGGLFFNATQKQSKTLSGVLSTLDDNVFNLRANLGKLFTPFLKKSAESTTKTIQELNKAIKGISVKDVQRELVAFNSGVIDYLIRPLELFANISKVVFDGVKLAIQGVVASLGFLGGKIADFLNNLKIDNETTRGLKDFQETSAQVFDEFARKANESVGGVFDTPISEKAMAFNAQLATELDTTVEVVNTAMDKVGKKITKTFDKAAAKIKQTTAQMNAVVNNVLAKGISNGIQQIVNNIGKGENAFKNFGKLMLQVIGEMAVKLGETLILAGLGIDSLKGLEGAQAVAAGIGLVAIGTIISNAAGSIDSSSGGDFAGQGALATQRASTDEDDVEQRQTATVFNIEVQGSLVQQEELGKFITDVQNEAREKNGIIDTNVRLA